MSSPRPSVKKRASTTPSSECSSVKSPCQGKKSRSKTRVAFAAIIVFLFIVRTYSDRSGGDTGDGGKAERGLKGAAAAWARLKRPKSPSPLEEEVPAAYVRRTKFRWKHFLWCCLKNRSGSRRSGIWVLLIDFLTLDLKKFKKECSRFCNLNIMPNTSSVKQK